MPAKQPAKTNILYKKTVLYASVVFMLRHYREYSPASHGCPPAIKCIGYDRRSLIIPMNHSPTLFDLAYKKERASARLLQLRDALSEEQALTIVLQRQAGLRGLEAMLAERRQEKNRTAQRQHYRSAQQANQGNRTCQALNNPATDCWQGWFDGSASPNPGRMQIGFLLRSPQGDETAHGLPAGYGDSSEAEYLALHALLETAIQLGVTKLVIHGDSQVVIDDVLERRQRPCETLNTLRQRAQSLLARLPDVQLRWVPRHRNTRADALARQKNDIDNFSRGRLAGPEETQ